MTAGITVNLLALATLLAYVLWHARSVPRAVRLRNAMLLLPGDGNGFDWTPPAYPAGFKVEQAPPTSEFRAIVTKLDIAAKNSDWAAALALASHLTEQAADKGPIRADLSTTYRAIRDGYGYCADFVKVFLGLAHAAGLVARQWSFSFDDFGGHGHTVIEIFDRAQRKWLLIDVFNNFHAVDSVSGEIVSALAFRDALLQRRAPVLMRANGPGRMGFVLEYKAIEYYLRGVDRWYLWWGNSVFSYYDHPLVGAAARFSQTVAVIVATLVGVQPRIRIYETAENVSSVRRMFALRRQLSIVALSAILLTFALIVQIVSALMFAGSGR